MAGESRAIDPPRDVLRALRWLTEYSPTPLLVTEGPLHLVRHANPAFLELFAGSFAGSPVNRPFAALFPELRPEAGSALLDLVYATGEPRQSPDFEHVHPRKGARVLALCVWPALDDRRGPRHLVIKARDGTDEAREIRRGLELAAETRQINERLVVAGVRMQELAEEAESARERLAVLAEIGGLLGASLDVATMVPAVARVLVPRLVDACAVEILAGPGVEATTVIEPAAASPQIERALARAREADVGAPLASSPDDERARDLAALGFGFSLSIPLRSPTRDLAVLTVLGRSGTRDPGDVTTLVSVADRLAMALERVDHYQRALGAAQAREELLATVAHDLRSPLHTVLFSLDLLAKLVTVPSPAAVRHVERIRHSAQYMQHLLTDLVDSAKIEAHRFLVVRAPCAVAPLIRDVVEMMLPLAASKSIRLEAAIDPTAASAIVWMDRDRMMQVLTNLLGNAVKFTPERGSIVVRASLRGGEILFAVHDSGPGIPRDDLDRVFDRFWQARGTAQLGAGLGLFIARGIVGAHGGTIWAESEVGAGSTLYVALPLAPPPDATAVEAKVA
jgi:signal transduction histidine kinase